MKKLSLIATVAMAAVACNTTNPLIEGWDTPYGIPDFGAVKEKHYVPALEAGIAQQQAEIDAIIANEEAPTFTNVVEAYERSGAILDRVANVLFNISESDATESLQNIGKSLGGRDHTTIIHGQKKIASELKSDEGLRNTIDIQQTEV